MTNTERVDKYLDRLSELYLDTFEKAAMVREAMAMFSDVNWVEALRGAAERQEKRYPGSNAMRGLFRYMAPELLNVGGDR